jgi:hypothetical protein
MEYIVLPFLAHTIEGRGAESAANQLQNLINEQAAQGWKFISLENAETIVITPANSGCFGIGATAESSRITRFDMAVFEK